MNPFSKLPLLGKKKSKSDEVVDNAALERQSKLDKIAFHRDHVRNGPVNFKTKTNGQVRRAKVRELAGRTKKARRAQLANYFATQQLAATVRGQLQLAGILPYVNRSPHYKLSVEELNRQVEAVVWIVKRFGIEDEDGTPSFVYDNVLAALSEALRFYGEAVGVPGLQVPSDYVLPVYEAGTEPEGSSFYGDARAIV